MSTDDLSEKLAKVDLTEDDDEMILDSSKMKFNEATAAADSGNPDAANSLELIDQFVKWVADEADQFPHINWKDASDEKRKLNALMWLRGSKWRLEKAQAKFLELEKVCADHFPEMSSFDGAGLSCMGGVDDAKKQSHIQERAKKIYGQKDAEGLEERTNHMLHGVGVVSAPRQAKDRLGRQALIIRPAALSEHMANGGKNDETAGDRARCSLLAYVGALMAEYESDGPEATSFDDALACQSTAASLGFTIILDMKGAPFLVNRSAQAEGDRVQKALPARVSSILVIDPPWFFKLIMAIISKFTSSKIIQRLKIVPRDSLVKEYFDADKLPVSLGGTLQASLDDFAKPPVFI